jgi:hypothetical protein
LIDTRDLLGEYAHEITDASTPSCHDGACVRTVTGHFT